MATKITFIGAGNMASSLAGGLIAKGVEPTTLTLADINEQQLQAARSTLGVATARDNLAACAKADVILVAVKPQVVAQVIPPLKDIVAQRKALVISIVAGTPLSRFAEWLGPDAAVVRCMPNTPALVELGATGMYANARVSDAQREQARQILSSVGLALWLDNEDQIDAITALSGSGPAYFFLVMEAMIAAGRALGLSESVARQMTLQTARGAAHMAVTSDVDAAELRRRVTSPGGTTERAIEVFEQGKLHELFGDALQAAYQRSKELASS
jgi:pyrroline-5-carboxylate reductase